MVSLPCYIAKHHPANGQYPICGVVVFICRKVL
nr:MAG TPA: hypothetical protein [Caudoviricetes sp.]